MITANPEFLKQFQNVSKLLKINKLKNILIFRWQIIICLQVDQ